MKKADKTVSASQVLGGSVLMGLIAILVLMALSSMLVLFGKVSGDFITQIALGVLAAGSFMTALLAAGRAEGRKLLWGLAGGAALFVCLLLLSLAWFGEPVQLTRTLLVGSVVLVTSVLGGVAGANIRPAKRKRK